MSLTPPTSNAQTPLCGPANRFKVNIPANTTLLPLPPRARVELGGERLAMRDNWLSNRVFASYEDSVDHCCAAWNKLVDQPWRIMSIGLRLGPRVLISAGWY